jgi:ketosteroid isomerase-like protein
MSAAKACGAIVLVLTLAACTGVRGPAAALVSGEAARVQVELAERAFARSMKDRDQKAFDSLVSAEAVFFTGPQPLRGKEQVLQWWSRYFSGPKAPFSWEPDQIEVLASGTLAISSGPVHDENGKLIARFSSIWRQEQPGVWRIIFDKGDSAGAGN